MRTAINRRSFLALLPLLGAACAAGPSPAPTATKQSPSAPAPTTAPAATAPTKPTSPPAATVPAKPTSAPAPTQAPAKPQTLLAMKFGGIQGVMENAYHLLGRDKGFFREFGIEPEFVDFQAGAPVLNGLISGELDVAHSSSFFAAVEQGADIKMVGYSKPRLSYALFARKQFTKLDDLVGRTFGASAPGSVTNVIIEALLDSKGIDPKSVDVVNIGSSPNVFKAVVAGKVDAGLAGSDFIPTAEADPDVGVLLHLAEALPKFGQISLVATGRSIKDKADGVQGWVNAWSKSYRYALDHKAETIDYSVKHLARSKEEASFGLDYNIQKRIVDPELKIAPDQIEYQQQVLVQVGQMKSVLPFDRVAEPRFQKKMMEALGQFKWPS